jgi:quinol monooxygenase YgiN
MGDDLPSQQPERGRYGRTLGRLDDAPAGPLIVATLLAHIQVKPGHETAFEAIAAELYRETHLKEHGCLRYEYWRGAAPGFYYSLLSFEDFHGFLRHQTSDHHEEASPRIGDTCLSVKLEWVDPIGESSPLPPTRMQALPEGADDKTTLHHKVFAAIMQEWWPS